MSLSKIHDIQLHGLANDLMHAKMNFQVFNAIRDNWDKRDALEQEDVIWVNYLKQNAVQQTLLYLSKIFDSNKNENIENTRCIRTFIKSIIENDLNKPLQVEFVWVPFFNKYQSVLSKFWVNGEKDSTKFLPNLLEFINKEFNKKHKRFSLSKLRLIRNKKVAHNESINFEVEIDYEEVMELILLAEATLEFTNEHLSLGQYAQYSNIDYVLNSQIDKIFKS
jgi:hypothetical protein